MNSPRTVLHQTNTDVKKNEEINCVDLPISTYDIDLHKDVLIFY